MKVVINKCWGGFGLSAAAFRRIAELLGRECYFFDYRHNVIGSPSNDFCHAFDTKDLSVLRRDWKSSSKEEREEQNQWYAKHRLPDFSGDRSNPLLVQVVEELGEASSGYCSKLAIVEIPDGIDWEIDEYDGRESIAERHRSWG